MKIGVVAVQGAVSEHIDMIDSAIQEMGKSGNATPVKTIPDMKDISALVIPGGESTTISKTLSRTGLHDEILKKAEEGLPIMGTCAGCILLAKEADDDIGRAEINLLSLIDMKVTRNAFGRQRESFEAVLDIEGLEKFHAVFIRAPIITKTWGSCKAIARIKEGIVMARQDNLLALAFHPELTRDNRIHKMFIGMV